MKRAAVVLLLLLAACSDGDDGDGADDGADASATTVDATTTTAGSSTTSTSRGPACESVDGPAPRGELTYLGADLDGDDEGDTAYTTLADDGWHLRADLGGDRGSVDELLTTVPTDEATVETAVDLDGDADDELWVVVGHGASSTVMGLFDLDGCDLEPVQLGGGPAEFAVGGSVLLLQGIRCGSDGRVTHLGATSEDGESYTTLDLTYELQAGELVRVDDASGALTLDDPAFPDYSQFNC